MSSSSVCWSHSPWSSSQRCSSACWWVSSCARGHRLLATVNLSNFSEFGLIVAAIGVINGWIPSDWMVVIAISLSLSYAIAAVLNAIVHPLYTRYRSTWRRWQRDERIADDRLIDVGDATIAVVGMGGVGTGAYDQMREWYGETVVGIDIDPITVRNQRSTGRKVLLGDPSDPDFWDRVQATHTLKLVMLALPRASTSLAVVQELKATGFQGQLAATARFPDEAGALGEAGAGTVFDIYSEAGAGFAAHVAQQVIRSNSTDPGAKPRVPGSPVSSQ